MLRRPVSPRRGAGNREPWKPGARLARLSASHSYGLVLMLIIATFVFMVAAPEAASARDVLVLIDCLTLAMALRASGIGWARPALGLIVLAASLAVLQLVVSGSTVVGLVALLEVVLVAATIAVIALGVTDQREVNRRSISVSEALLGQLYLVTVSALLVGSFSQSRRELRRSPEA